MKPVEIEVVVDEAGQASIHVTGAKGTSCRELTQDLERALGKVTGRRMTLPAREAAVQVRRCARR